jgi:ABC-type lipoprotein export system ATPase subunit
MAMSKESHKYSETLDIENFLTIKKFNWEIKPFNIITGDMGSGKSLCIKLLYFFEQIFVSSIFFAPGFSRKLFENGSFFDRVSLQFEEYFYLKGHDPAGLMIAYAYANTDTAFSVSVKWDGEKKKLVWESDYLTKNLKKWGGYFGSDVTPDTANLVRSRILDEIKHDFWGKLPIATMFVPASRAALAIVKKPAFMDEFLSSFWDDRDFIMTKYRDIKLSGDKAKILHVDNIKKNKNEEDYDVILEHADGRKVPLLFSSSGQQELVFLLLLMEKLPTIKFLYGESLSIYIEEPSAHLFPKEQKQLIENIVSLFREQKEFDRRFFITTHSPYILNIVNNMLDKGRLEKTIDALDDPQLKNTASAMYKDLRFPSLMREEVSAVFINDDGSVTPMISDDDPYLYSSKIEDITRVINNDAGKINNIFKQIGKE